MGGGRRRRWTRISRTGAVKPRPPGGTLRAVSKTALVDALKAFDLDTVRQTLRAEPELRDVRLGRGLNLLEFCCSRSTVDDDRAARRQLKMAQWLVEFGFDPTALHTTAPGEDGEEALAQVSLVWFAVAKARNDRLARYFLAQGVDANAFFAAVWWANARILPELVAHGGDINRVVGATPLHMAVSILDRGTEGRNDLAKQRLNTLKTLLRLGADPNIPAMDGTTPLRTALDKAYDIEVFTLLLKHRADPDARGTDGRSVREVAARKRDRRYLAALTQ
jgi:hypothetical protein